MAGFVRRGRTLLVLVVGVAAVFFVARLATRRIVDRRLAKEVALVRAAGAPLTLDEIPTPGLPDLDNAARIYEQAFALLVTEEKSSDGAGVRLATVVAETRGCPLCPRFGGECSEDESQGR